MSIDYFLSMNLLIIVSNSASDCNSVFNLFSACSSCFDDSSLSNFVTSSQVFLVRSLRSNLYVVSDSSFYYPATQTLLDILPKMAERLFFASSLCTATLCNSHQRSRSSCRKAAICSSPILSRVLIASSALLEGLLLCFPSKMGLRLETRVRGGSYISKLRSLPRTLSKRAPQKRAGPLGYSLKLICWSRGESTDSITQSCKYSFRRLYPAGRLMLSWVLLKLHYCSWFNGLLGGGGGGGMLGLLGVAQSSELSWVRSMETCSSGDLSSCSICWQSCGLSCCVLSKVLREQVWWVRIKLLYSIVRNGLAITMPMYKQLIRGINHTSILSMTTKGHPKDHAQMLGKNNSYVDHHTKLALSSRNDEKTRGKPSGGFETLEAPSKKLKKDPFSTQMQAIDSINKFERPLSSKSDSLRCPPKAMDPLLKILHSSSGEQARQEEKRMRINEILERRKLPIIIVPHGPMTGSLGLSNIEKLLNAGEYVSQTQRFPDHVCKCEISLTLRGRKVNFEVWNNARLIGSAEWYTVVAVFVEGKKDQFQGWPCPDPDKIFKKARGLMVRWSDKEKEELQWNVKELILDRSTRYRDAAVQQQILSELQGVLFSPSEQAE